MGREVVLFKSEEKRMLTEVAEFLHQLADKLAEKQVILRQGNQELVLTIPDRVELEIKAEEEVRRDKTKRQLEIEIEWIEGEDYQGGVTLG